ncbi:hypothetical protein [Roseibium sp. M-1]
MITITSPSMCLNDSRAAVNYTMDVTRTVQTSDTQQQMVDRVVAAAGNATGGRIDNLILTAHGFPGSFQIGTGLNKNTMAPWASVRGKVFKIWFRGCLVARIAGPHTSSHGDHAALVAVGATSGNGHEFIRDFARLTGCYVVAPTEIQASNRQSYPSGQMDSYEGLVLSYDPQGTISWQRRYPSCWGYNAANGTIHVPNRE